jgi:ribonuclease HII
MTARKRSEYAPDLIHERELSDQGFVHIVGIDEAGRGAWAGPVTAAAVQLPLERFNLASTLAGVDDSKRMNPTSREEWNATILSIAAIGVGEASAEEIDEMGLIAATRTAMVRAIHVLPSAPDFLLIDYIALPDLDIPQRSLPYGDARSYSIAAASIIAKVTRDRTMTALGESYPEYGFARHKGYGTKAHRKALQKHGPTPIHRKSFKPIAACLNN